MRKSDLPSAKPVRWRRLSHRLPAALLLCLLLTNGCSENQPERKAAAPPQTHWPTLPPKPNVPEFMKGTVWEVADMDNKTPYPISGYGLVVGLDNTGSNNGVPMAVRNFIFDEMVKHGLGSKNQNLGALNPERVLEDPQTAIVEVWGLIPVGARVGQRVDIYVQACTGSQTRSLARGRLYQTDLFVGGVDPIHPKGHVNAYMKAKGAVFVNPGYADQQARSDMQASARASLRTGMILGGGICTDDREIWIRVRQPQLSMSRAIEYRVNNRFRDMNAARAQDEGLVYAFVPKSLNGDWEHFMGVAMHLYLNDSPGFGAMKAKQLAEEAAKPNALLQDISYCWEGIGEDALPFMQPLYLSQSPDVAYAAARAGAFLGDANAEETLVEMASAETHPFQLNAVKTLGSLPDSPRVNRALDRLVSTAPSALVRIEAYKILAERGSNNIISTRVGDSFILDRVFSMGAPLVYATRSSVPRIALFGNRLNLKTPMMFSGMGDRLTISSTPDNRGLTIYDRTDDRRPVGTQVSIPPDLGELVLRLGNAREDGFKFGYGDLVSILKQLSDNKQIAANFVLQDLPQLQDAIEDAPPLVDPTGNPPQAADSTGGLAPTVGLKQ